MIVVLFLFVNLLLILFVNVVLILIVNVVVFSIDREFVPCSMPTGTSA